MTTFGDMLNQTIAGWNFNSAALRNLLQALLKYLKLVDVDIESMHGKEEAPASSSSEKMDEILLQTDNLKNEIEELQQKSKAMEKELQDLHRQINLMQEEVTDLSDQVRSTKEEMTDFSNQLTELKSDIVEVSEQSKSMKTFVEEFCQVNGKVQDDQKKLNQVGGLLVESDRAVIDELMNEVNTMKALVDNLMQTQPNISDLEEKLQRLEAASKQTETVAEDKELRSWVLKLQEDVDQLKAAQAVPLEEDKTTEQLQSQLDNLRGLLEDIVMSLTCSEHDDHEDLADDDDVEDLSRSNDRTALTSKTTKLGLKLKMVFEHIDQMQDKLSNLPSQQQPPPVQVQAPKDRSEKEVDLNFMSDVQGAFKQLEVQCGKLSESTRSLQEENRQKQNHIDVLYNTTAMLEKKSNQQEAEAKTKVNRQEFDAVTEQLHSLLNGLLEKMTVHEQDWLKFVADVHKQMENKLDRMELDKLLKKKLKARWKEMFAKLQAEGGDERDAACVKKKLLETFRCLSCDRPTMMSPHWQKLPCYPSWTPIKTSRPFSAWDTEQLHEAVMAGQPKAAGAGNKEVTGKHHSCNHGGRRSTPHEARHGSIDGKILPKLDGIKVDGVPGGRGAHDCHSPCEGKAPTGTRSRRGSHKSSTKVYNKYELPVRTTKINIKTKDPPTSKMACARCFACSVKEEPPVVTE